MCTHGGFKNAFRSSLLPRTNSMILRVEKPCRSARSARPLCHCHSLPLNPHSLPIADTRSLTLQHSFDCRPVTNTLCFPASACSVSAASSFFLTDTIRHFHDSPPPFIHHRQTSDRLILSGSTACITSPRNLSLHPTLLDHSQQVNYTRRQTYFGSRR